jgi:sugar lactone lactonase YvrE
MDGPTLPRGLGVQVFDRNGRVAAVLPLPGNAAGTSLCFGGHDFDTLYVAVVGKCIAESFMCRARPHGLFRSSFRPGDEG